MHIHENKSDATQTHTGITAPCFSLQTTLLSYSYRPRCGTTILHRRLSTLRCHISQRSWSSTIFHLPLFLMHC